MSNNRLTYKKIMVDSLYRLPQSKSSSDFIIELDENVELPNGTKMYITEVSIPATYKTTEVGFYEYLYVMLYNDITGTNELWKSFRVYLGNRIYFAEQLSFDMVKEMNDAVRSLVPGNVDLFVYAYSSATRTVEIKIADGISNFSFKIPTDDELSNYVNNIWNTATDSVDSYDNSNPLSINYLLSNYVSTSPLTVWTSSYLNLVPFRALYINCPQLCDHHVYSPNSYSSSIIKKVICDAQLGGIITDISSAFHPDFVDVGGKNIKRLEFRITDGKSKTMNLYNIPCQFSLVFEHPSY